MPETAVPGEIPPPAAITVKENVSFPLSLSLSLSPLSTASDVTQEERRYVMSSVSYVLLAAVRYTCALVRG